LTNQIALIIITKLRSGNTGLSLGICGQLTHSANELWNRITLNYYHKFSIMQCRTIIGNILAINPYYKRTVPLLIVLSEESRSCPIGYTRQANIIIISFYRTYSASRLLIMPSRGICTGVGANLVFARFVIIYGLRANTRFAPTVIRVW